MGAGRRALGPSHTSPSQHSVPQGENKLPKSYQGTKTPLTLLRQLHCSASSQTCSKCCTDFPSAKYINTNNRFSPLLPTAPGSDSTAQAHCTVSPHSAHGALGSIEFLFPLVSFFSVFFLFFLIFLSFFQPEPMQNSMLAMELPLGVSPCYLDMSYIILADYLFYL